MISLREHNMEEWIGEINQRLGVSVKFRLKKIIHRYKSPYFEIIVAETYPLGKVLLFKEGESYTIQSAEKFDFYDEVLAHVPLMAHPSPATVLIIGGGDGIVLREVLKYHTIKEVVVVEIDPKVVEICKKYLKLDRGAFEDPRVKIVYDDAAEFVKKTKNKFDVIIGDYSDPYQDLPAGPLISEEFYCNVNRLLKEDGVLAVQAGSPIFQREIFKRIYSNARKVFKIVKIYVAPVPYYPGALWAFMAASNSIDPSVPRNKHVNGTEYYDVGIHSALFILPKFVRNTLESIDET